MAQVPRIRRVEPNGPITQPYEGIRVAVRLVWHDGATTSVDALAVAWTTNEVEIEWTTPWNDTRRDWIRADQVSRRSDRAYGLTHNPRAADRSAPSARDTGPAFGPSAPDVGSAARRRC